MTTDNKKEQTSALENADGAKNIAEEKKGGKISGFIKQFFDIKFWKFILVGIINTLVGEGVVLLLTNPVGWKQFSWGPGAAAFAGIVVGSIVSFFLNKYFTFKSKEKGWKPVLRFTVNIVACMLVRVAVATGVSALSKAAGWTMFGWDINTFAGNLSWAVGAVVFVACNYVGQRFFAFREKKEKAEKTK